MGDITVRDIRSFDLNMLRVLDALAQERSVTRAAQRLGLTQPAVSGLLLRLRESFGDPLLVRAHRGMSLTPRALELAPVVRRVLVEIEVMLQPPRFDPTSARFTLTMAASDYASSVLAPPFVAALRREAPGVRVVMRPLTASVSKDLAEGGTDLALMAAVADPGLHVERLFEEHFVCLMRAGHPAASGELSLDVFCSLAHALVAFDGGFEGPTDDVLAGSGRERRVAISVSNFLLLSPILCSTDLIAVAPARLVADAPGLVRRTPPLALPSFAVSAVWHERFASHPARAWAVSKLIEASGLIDRAGVQEVATAALSDHGH